MARCETNKPADGPAAIPAEEGNGAGHRWARFWRWLDRQSVKGGQNREFQFSKRPPAPGALGPGWKWQPVVGEGKTTATALLLEIMPAFPNFGLGGKRLAMRPVGLPFAVVPTTKLGQGSLPVGVIRLWPGKRKHPRGALMSYLPSLHNRCREFLGSEWLLQERHAFEAVAQYLALRIAGGEHDGQVGPGLPCRLDHLDPTETGHRVALGGAATLARSGRPPKASRRALVV